MFSGDLNYNISLLELDGGYPINISYSSAIGMTEEASALGFGWQLNIGRINRTVRGLPDDFNGDVILRTLSQQKEWTIGLGAGVDAEIFGLPIGVGVSGGLTFSNMRGVDIATNLGVKFAKDIGGTKLSAGLNIGISNNEGASISPNIGLQYRDFSLQAGATISSMEGIKQSGFLLNYNKLQQYGSASFPLTMARTPFTPKIEFPVNNNSGSFKFRFGGEIWGFSGGAEVYGNVAIQDHPVQQRPLNSFGYLYLQNQSYRNSIMDIGTEKESPVFEEDKNLSITYLANDVFSVSAQGLSGTFRPFRTDVGIIHNENMESNSVGGSLGGEVHTGGYAQVGIDVTANLTNTSSGAWDNNNNLTSICQFSTGVNGLPVYFKSVGETTVFTNSNALDALGGTTAASFTVRESILENSLNGNQLQAKNIGKRPEATNISFQFLTALEASQARKPLVYYKDHGANKKIVELPRYDNVTRKPHHVSYITITKDDGTVYEFGIAAYNTIQKEVSFNIDVTENPESNLFNKTIGFNAGTDNTSGNSHGLIHYFTSTETPPYAYAYLLTAVYSADYVDLTGDGPTRDDLGTYTRFNYTLEDPHFKWRTPYKDANYSAANLCDTKDDMASYVYGEKEIWMIHSIETKNYMAEFFNSSRDDAYEVKGEEGGIDEGDSSLKRIDSIKLYSMADYNGTDPVPVKTIFFTYKYSLCPGLPASKTGEGKLTLKKIAFQYDKSQKETQSYYTFQYNNENDHAFGYNETAIDVWGNYKKIKAGTNNVRFPYTTQNKVDADENAQAWDLIKITLPSGGAIGIEYEAKDYAFVQNKQAMQMYEVKGFMNGANKTYNLYENDGTQNKTLVVDVGKNISGIKDFSKYFKEGEKLYINCIITAGKNANIDKEIASGFFDVDFNSIKPFGPSQPSWIKIDLIDPKANPVSHALWQKMRKTLTHILYPPVIKPDAGVVNNVMSVVKDIPSTLSELIGFFNSYETKMMDKERGKCLDNQYASFARLYNPDGRKFGSGSRVKKITQYDNWDLMTGGSSDAAVYGQEYSYDMQLNGSKETISSGVATYEPIGNEENPFVLPTGGFNNANALAPELYYYKTEPFGESFFPAPSVGYSLVTVRDLHDKTVTKNTTGLETYEYYTAKDYPVITSRTTKQGVPVQSVSPFYSLKKYTASQGFYVEINDMHGKMKAHKVYSSLDARAPLSGVEYIYKNANGTLNNIVSTINSTTGKISHASQVGIDYDFNIATDETRSLVKSPALQFNIDVIPAVLGIPFPVPSFLPFYSENLLQYRGVTTTKLLYRTGLVDSIIAYDNGISTSTKNILYDDSTGQVIVTTANNEYNRPYFTTNLPAHWFNEGMGPASVNANKSFTNFSTANVDKEPAFHEGDQLLLVANIPSKAWVFKNSAGKKSIIDEQGNLVNNTFDIVRIIHSGRKNMQGASAGQIITSADPSAGDKLLFLDTTVIDATAIEYNEYWQSYYAIHPLMTRDSCLCRGEDFNLNGYKIILNNDGSIRTPSSASIHLSEINDIFPGKCGNIKIVLDNGFTNWKPCFDTATISFSNFRPLVPPGFCTSTSTATGNYTITSNCDGASTVIQRGTFTFSGGCLLVSCHDASTHVTNPLICNVPVNTPVNPYMLGILGNWRPRATYHYITERTYPSKKFMKDLGGYKNFALCLSPINGFLFGSSIDKTKWQTKDKVVVTDPHSKTLESLDALKIPQSQLIGYGYNLPVATAGNANYYEIAFDGFEDYDYLKSIQSPLSGCSIPPHFKFENITGGSRITETASHTGTKSLWIEKGSPVSMERTIDNECKYPFDRDKYDAPQYFLNKCDIVSQFSPVPGKEYVISLWVNEQRTNNDLDASQPLLSIEFRDSKNNPIGIALSLRSKGPIIDNWQLLNENFTVPANAAKVSIQLFNSNAGMFVDDIRIQPFSSSMKAYVYDPVKLRVMAILDEQNFATFYEYDNEGQLTREKKETERGIMTIKEVRSAKPKSEKLGF
ncbi:hypothetical protein SAMN04488505_103489 [Chitinophaga rupis]|uniref:Uncharacterized protein n=2 Tax=Chitinophaga rupis TaxID=573321 RepID=A0A1H7VXU1_9BACT|nr:hypothetical protein SAMN04488505_103489 [Chitinophaga rupis]